jgi:hypothetical protein
VVPHALCISRLIEEWMKAILSQVRPALRSVRAGSTCVVLLLSISFAIGQGTLYPISEGNITDCSGTLGTSNVGPGGTYGNNEDFASTICSSEPGQVIFLSFGVFNLSTDGPILQEARHRANELLDIDPGLTQAEHAATLMFLDFLEKRTPDRSMVS